MDFLEAVLNYPVMVPPADGQRDGASYGVTYKRFAAQFWDQLDEETRDFLHALEQLLDALKETRRIAGIS